MTHKEYTVAVLSDVHGNAAALRAALTDLKDRPHDAMVFAGDYVLFGPRPAEALELIREQNKPAIHGNTDRFITHGSGGDGVADAVQWVANRLNKRALTYLRELPFEQRLTPPGGAGPQDDLLIVHATPTDVDAVLILEPDPFDQHTVTEEAEAKKLVGDAEANLILYGHIHYTSAGAVDGRRLASIGAVGFPFDGDPRAAYALVHWNGEAWRVEHIRVPYDHGSVAAELAATDAPFADFASERLRQARFVPSDA
jgi:predicted phosphodiesterase